MSPLSLEKSQNGSHDTPAAFGLPFTTRWKLPETFAGSKANAEEDKMAKRTVTIRFSTDKNGRPMAHYWGLACRWLPISLDKAELWIATGKAVRQ